MNERSGRSPEGEAQANLPGPEQETGGMDDPMDAAAEEGAEAGSSAGPAPTVWTELVEKIQRGDQEGMAELYQVFSKGIRFYLCRQLGPQELEDKIHDTFLIVVQAVQRGDLRDPERLMGFVRTVVRRQVAGCIDVAVHVRKEHADLELGIPVPDARQNPEEAAMLQERTEIMAKVLRGISSRDREILTRFYILEQPQEQICQEMHLSETQFRLLKSRAKARFGEWGKKKFLKSPISSFFLRGKGVGGH
jgi:RNA polymerase sigma-70 factor, ECF subfamily